MESSYNALGRRCRRQYVKPLMIAKSEPQSRYVDLGQTSDKDQLLLPSFELNFLRTVSFDVC